MRDNEEVFPPIKETESNEAENAAQMLWMPIGLAIGTSLGVVFDQLAIGIAVGISIGVAMDQILSNQQSNHA